MTTHTATPRRLYLIQVAARSAPEATWPVPYPCYLVQMSDGKEVLIDSGFPQDPPPRPGLQQSKNVVEQLALLDLQPGDIDLLICTHFDLDHCGHHEDFPNAELVVQREHYDVAHGGINASPSLAPTGISQPRATTLWMGILRCCPVLN